MSFWQFSRKGWDGRALPDKTFLSRVYEKEFVKTRLCAEPPNEDPEFAQNLQCDECDKVCKTQKQLTHHKHYHKYYLNGPQIFCQICDKNIPEKLFVRHVDTVHPG